MENFEQIISELNVEVTFKIAITNEKITDDEPYRQNKDIPIEVTIDELADYYDENFIKYTGEENNALTVKTKDGKEYDLAPYEIFRYEGGKDND